jgi:hypothetical protein
MATNLRPKGAPASWGEANTIHFPAGKTSVASKTSANGGDGFRIEIRTARGPLRPSRLGLVAHGNKRGGGERLNRIRPFGNVDGPKTLLDAQSAAHPRVALGARVGRLHPFSVPETIREHGESVPLG